MSSPIIDHAVKTITGEEVRLSAYRGKALLIVNTASACGYTPQYQGLQELYERYQGRGLEVLGFPCNDFGAQEPGDEAEIKGFCEARFGVSFPLFAKVHAKGPEKAALYRALTEETEPPVRGEVRWNFTKFLVGADGQVLRRFEPGVAPLSQELCEAVEGALP